MLMRVMPRRRRTRRRRIGRARSSIIERRRMQMCRGMKKRRTFNYFHVDCPRTAQPSKYRIAWSEFG
jgi:hypothetical protein